MARTKGSRNKPKTPDAEKIAALFGFDIEEVKSKVERHTPPAKVGLEVDAAVDYMLNPQGWYDKECKTCGHRFAANYKFVAFCSLACRKDELGAMGLEWDPTRPLDQRYIDLGIEPPGIVPPALLDALIRLGHRYSVALQVDEGEDTQS